MFHAFARVSEHTAVKNWRWIFLVKLWEKMRMGRGKVNCAPTRHFNPLSLICSRWVTVVVCPVGDVPE